MDVDTLSRAMGRVCSMERYAELLPGMQQAMIAADCTTVRRAAMWCAQLGQESVGLSAMREYASGDEYDTRTDLGNTPQVDGDGRRYAGRGPIQITGTANYRQVSQWAHDHGYVPTPRYFLDHPEQLEQPRYGFLGAVWYWTVARPQINRLCDAGDLEGVTRAINGGVNGLAQRRANYVRCLGLGDALLPTDERFLMSLDEKQQVTILAAAIQTGSAQVAVPDKDEAKRVLGPRTQRHTEFYNVDGNPKFAKAGAKLAYLRAMVMDLWNELVFDGYPAVEGIVDAGLDEGRFGSPVRFIIATHANSVRTLRVQAAIARKVGVSEADLTAALGGEK